MAFPSPATNQKIRVLIVDDSAFMRHALERMLQQLPDVEVVGFAADGVEGIKRALELRPDVITMDVEMPKMDGVKAVAEIMQVLPTPIVMLSTLTTAGAETTLRALEAGAVEFVAKPGGLSRELVAVGEQLSQAIHRASQAHLRRRRPAVSVLMPTASPIRSIGISDAASHHIVVIGSSTGGPPALTEVVPHLPGDLPAGVVVVQHMPPGFTAALAKRLDSLSPLSVSEAKDGDLVAAGRVLIAPGDFHLVIGPTHRVRLEQGPPLHGVRPAVDVTLDSVARVYGKNTSVAILTGMGKDGADGAAKIEAAGGQVVVQDEATCIVYGMPKVARERTRHSIEAPLENVADALVRTVPARG
jgi:two-component system chemotaxis response regulator CheB